MKVNMVEAMFVNSWIRRFMQKYLEVPLFTKIGGLPKTKRVAEIGCGSGYGLRLLLDFYKPNVVHGFDIDEKMLNRASSFLAKEIMEHRVFLHNEDDSLSQLKSNTFSTVFFFGSLHHIPKWRLALNAASESVEEGGKMYLWEFYRPLTMNWFVKLFVHHPAEAAFSHSELGDELIKNKMDVIGQFNFLGLAGMYVVEKNTGKSPRSENLNSASSFTHNVNTRAKA